MRNIIKEKAQKERSTIKDKKRKEKNTHTVRFNSLYHHLHSREDPSLVDLERNPKRKGSGVRDRENPAT